MNKIKIFLASSFELKEERIQFELEISRKNKIWYDKDIFIHLEIWEDSTGQLAKDGKQNEYNKKVKDADLFVLLVDTKLGMYSSQEFEAAFGQFHATNKPFIFTYFKETTNKTEHSLTVFQNKLAELEHFICQFKDSNDLWNQFNKELERLDEAKFAKNEFTKEQNSIYVNNDKAKIKYQIINGTFKNPTFN